MKHQGALPVKHIWDILATHGRVCFTFFRYNCKLKQENISIVVRYELRHKRVFRVEVCTETAEVCDQDFGDLYSNAFVRLDLACSLDVVVTANGRTTVTLPEEDGR